MRFALILCRKRELQADILRNFQNTSLNAAQSLGEDLTCAQDIAC